MIMSTELKNEVVSMKRSGTCTNPVGEYLSPGTQVEGEIGSNPESTRPYTRHSLIDIFEYIVTYKLFHDGNSPTVREGSCVIWEETKLTRRALAGRSY